MKHSDTADQAEPLTEEPVPPPRRCACGQVSHHTDGWCGSNCAFSSSPPKPPRIYGHNTHLHTLEPYYSRHVSAMTEEGLHSKSDIAAELAFRDKEIARLALGSAPVEKFGVQP